MQQTFTSEQMPLGGAVSRREFVLGGGLLAVAASVPSCVSQARTSEPPLESADQMRLMMRMMASSGEACVPWYYTGRIYAVRSAAAPLHLYNFEGTEIYWVKPLVPERWSVAVSTLTFYLDTKTDAYLEQFENPLTGRTVEVKPNVLRTTPGHGAVYGDRVITMLGEPIPVTIDVHRDREYVWITTSRASQHAPQPSMEVNSIFSPAADVDARAPKVARATMSSVYLSRWPKWLEMGEQEGHLMWHAAGRKLNSIDDLPIKYRQRADSQRSRHFENPENDSKG